jgi:hypothetical protein
MRTQVCVIGLVAVVVNPCVAQSPSVVRHRFAARHPPAAQHPPAVRTLAVILAAAHGYSIGSEHAELPDVVVGLNVVQRRPVAAHPVAASGWLRLNRKCREKASGLIFLSENGLVFFCS